MAKTELTPKQLFERRNNTDVFNKEVIAGLLRVLNRKLVYEQVWNDETDEIQNVTVPFFYDFGGGNINSQRFIQDNYTFFSSDECTDIGIKKIDGNYDFYPQGRIALTSVSIDSGNITNRFSMASYTKIEDGQLRSYTSYLYSMPLQFQFSLEIRAKEMITAFKIDEKVREFFYKNKTFHFNYKGTVCAARVGFPESQLQTTAGSTYTMGQQPNDTSIKLSMNIQVETYQPVFDPYSEIPADKNIKESTSSIWVNNTVNPHNTPKRAGEIYWVTNLKDVTLCSGATVLLEWNERYIDKDLLNVDICYQKEGSDKIYVIASVDNHHYYRWNIPYDFTENYGIDVMIPNSEIVSVATQPQIIVYPDPKTKMVEPNQSFIVNKGFFIAPEHNSKVKAILSYVNKNEEIIEHPATLNLENYMIDDRINGIDFDCFLYDNTINVTKIRLMVRDHGQKSVFCVSDWISVV